MTYLNQFCCSSQAFRSYILPGQKYNSYQCITACSASVERAGLVQLLWKGRGSYNLCGKGGACTTYVERVGLMHTLMIHQTFVHLCNFHETGDSSVLYIAPAIVYIM